MKDFWGPNMRKVLEWADSEKIAWHKMSPIEFAVMLSERLGVELSPHMSPEDAAAAWLEAIDERGPTTGH